MIDVILKRFENPGETRFFEKGEFEIVELGGMTIGRATWQPGWRWSEEVSSALGESHCRVGHVSMASSGARPRHLPTAALPK